ncbi:MAG: serine/threonine protein kinase [Caeruleum heppii]|nr:MAG: serine/threonine protein kinase [Caeruleum heppii]
MAQMALQTTKKLVDLPLIPRLDVSQWHSSNDIAQEFRIQGLYFLQLRLGGGGFGQVYQARHLQTGQEVALKLESHQIEDSLLQNEINIYEELAGGPGIPRVYWHGEDLEFWVMAFELLGPTLEDLRRYCHGWLSLKTVLMLADQLIHRFRYIHRKRFIHRDVKPENLLMGDGLQGNKVYVADIGTAQEIYEPTIRHWDDERRERRKLPMIGTTRYASINAHLGVVQSPCDDMEALGYVLIYLLRGSLPWQDLETDDQEQERQLVLEKKQSISAQELCEGLPEEFLKYLNHVRSLRSNDMPDYAYLRRLFANLFRRRGYEYDYVFDWTELKFLESLEQSGRGTTDC